MSSQIWLNIQSLFWEMQLYMSWYIRSFFGFTFLNILYFFKYSCTNIFHRRSLYTFYWCRQWLAAWRHQAITWTIVDFPLITPLGIFHSNSIWNHTRKCIRSAFGPIVCQISAISFPSFPCCCKVPPPFIHHSNPGPAVWTAPCNDLHSRPSPMTICTWIPIAIEIYVESDLYIY